MEKTILIFLCAIACCISGCTSLTSFQTEEGVKATLMKLTPLGSKPEEVLALAEKKGLKNVDYNKSRGMPKTFCVVSSGKEEFIGNSYIFSEIGHHYTFPIFMTVTNVYWAFDETDHLIEIRVLKSLDGP